MNDMMVDVDRLYYYYYAYYQLHRPRL